jgi:hypothetical protein
MKLSLKRIYSDRAEVKAALDARAMRAPTKRGGGARGRVGTPERLSVRRFGAGASKRERVGNASGRPSFFRSGSSNPTQEGEAAMPAIASCRRGSRRWRPATPSPSISPRRSQAPRPRSSGARLFSPSARRVPPSALISSAAGGFRADAWSRSETSSRFDLPRQTPRGEAPQKRRRRRRPKRDGAPNA